MSSELFLGDIAEITMGQSPAGVHCNKEGDGFPLLNGPTEFGDSHPMPVQFTTDPKKKANKGDLLFCVRGSTTGRMNWADQEYSIGRGIAAIRGKNGYPNSFIRTLIELQLEGLLVQATGSTFPNVSGKMLSELCVPEISVKSASAIAGIIEPIDDRIALLRETNSTLESIAQAMFKSWFIDFDPVKAKQQGEEPQGMDAATAALFPDAFQDSELGPIPARWEVAKLEDVYEINPGRKLKKREIAPYLGMSSVPTYGHSVGEVIDREMASGTKFINGDTLLARITPCLENGKTAYVDFLDDEQVGWGSTEFIVLRPRAPFPSYHAYLLCRDSSFRTFAIQSMSGTSGRQRVQNDVLGSYRLVLPSEEILTAFSDVIEPIQMAMTSNHKRVQTLASIRDALLPRLISGKLRLPEAEAMAGEATA